MLIINDQDYFDITVGAGVDGGVSRVGVVAGTVVVLTFGALAGVALSFSIAFILYPDMLEPKRVKSKSVKP